MSYFLAAVLKRMDRANAHARAAREADIAAALHVHVREAIADFKAGR